MDGESVEKVFSGEGWLAVYGAGYVGLSLAAVFLRHGIKVICVDVDEEKLSSIESGILDNVEDDIREAIRKGLGEDRLVLTSDGVEASKNSLIKTVTVPVYIDWESKDVDLAAIDSVSKDIACGLKRGDLIIYESSMPPGTTEDFVKPILEEVSGLRAGEDFFLGYSPERIYVGRAVKDIEDNYPKIVSGVDPESLDMVANFYSRIAGKGVIRLSSTTVAEFEKLIEGIYRDVNIALANELALAAMKLGIDYFEAREAANSQPYCHLHLPGPGVGGYCIPLYPYFVLRCLRERGFDMELTGLARRVNERMPSVVVGFVDDMAAKYGLEPSDVRVCVLGVAFRGETDDVRLSPSHDIISLLVRKGYNNIIVHDPYVRRDKFLEDLDVDLTDDLENAVRDAVIIIIAAGHRMYRGLRLSQILRKCRGDPIVIDTVSSIDVDVAYDRLLVLGRGRL